MLRTDDLFPNSSRQAWESEYVFQQVGPKVRYSQCYCTERMSEVCPYQIHTPAPKPSPKKRTPCSVCGKGHLSATSLMICQTRHIIRTQYNQPWSTDGTTENLYNVNPPEWSQSYYTSFRTWMWPSLAGWITHRDKNICQDCGVHGDTIIGKTRWGTNEYPTMEVHHIIPRAHGGGDHPWNLKLVCQNCHKKYNEKFNGEIISRKAKERKRAGMKMPKSLEEFEVVP